MIRFYFLLIVLFLEFNLHGQSFKVPQLDTLVVPKVDAESRKLGRMTLAMSFAQSHLVGKADLSILKGKSIRKIQLIYTDYPKGASLHKLNTGRLRKLYQMYPKVFKDSTIKWELVKQTACVSQKEASQLFHGFMIWYVEDGLASGRGDEIESLEKILEGEIVPEDSTILKVMERHPEWNNMLVVADLTGSMSPYVGQLLLWLKLKTTTHPAKYFVFFNDGDAKNTFQKKIGETGGIYTSPYTTMDSLLDLAKTTMKNGWGGDTPENNIEATLKGIQEYPDFDQLIMIADNWAIPRDLALLKQIKSPIKIILCGTERGVNPIYLDIARKNKGSIHTIEEDLENLVELIEGQTLDIGNKRFQIKNGEFVEVKKEATDKDK